MAPPPAELTLEQIKQRTGEFDVDSVYTLGLAGLGLRSIAVVAGCPSLTELDLSDNNLSALDALAGLVQLKNLIVSANRVQRLEPLRGLESLHTLRLDANNVSNLDEVHHLAQLPSLEVLYFRKVYEDIAGPNPICGHPAYRPTVLRLVPRLTNLDGERIRSDENAKTLYAAEPDDGAQLPPLARPVIMPVFAQAELDAFKSALSGASAVDPEGGKQLQAALHDSRRLMAKAASLVTNYSQPES
ncbi:hypothetical protein T492DRAFT_1085629 [Pavlovales sp. CCMP2436]|nr:hypothetical protein T492DRAFT_1085629 [Pavlovales sp. CCMP2436]